MYQFTCPQVALQPEISRLCKLCPSTDVVIKQTLNQSVKDSVVSHVTVIRLFCKTCGYSWRCYPEGVRDYSGRTKRLVFLGVILYSAGLSYEKCEGFLSGMVGRKLEHCVTIWRDVQAISEKLRRRDLPRTRQRRSKDVTVTVGLDGTYVRVNGEEQPLLLAINMATGTTITIGLCNEWKEKELEAFVKEVARLVGVKVQNLKIVTDDLDTYKAVAQKQCLTQQVCLGHVKKNLKKRLKKLKKKLPHDMLATVGGILDPPQEEVLNNLALNPILWKHSKRSCKAWVAYRGIVGDLRRNWRQYTAYLTDPTLPTTNNRTEQAIGRSKIRYKVTRGFKAKTAILNFFTLTQQTGMHQFSEIATVC